MGMILIKHGFLILPLWRMFTLWNL